MKYRIMVTERSNGMFCWHLISPPPGHFVCKNCADSFTREDAIADARRFAELLKVEVEIDG